jgi:hypothetical protein
VQPGGPEHVRAAVSVAVHMREADTPTGWQISYLESGAAGEQQRGNGMDPKYLNEKDGFSVLGALLFRSRTST